jgi:ParE toxin of type II toxin-antitoxin system, parDE
MGGKVVSWTRIALLTLNETLDFFILRNANAIYSKKLYKEVAKNETRLINNPLLGIKIKDTPYRKLIFDNYSIYYKNTGSKITIVLFWDNRRSPELLEQELQKILPET